MPLDFDPAKLVRWLEVNIRDFHGPIEVKKFPDGQSNPTYRIISPSRVIVLRRKPFGDLLPSAHAVDREFQLLAGLHPAGFPVPEPLGLCTDTDIIGAVFYVMSMADGRTFWDSTLPDQSKSERRAIYVEMAERMAQLHQISYRAAGLQDFERPGNYFGRQVKRWIGQYRASQTDDIPEMEHLIAWLPDTVPEQSGHSVIHGDFRIDNLIFHRERPKVLAVIDWELATIGDPIADLSYFAMHWLMPPEIKGGLAGVNFAATGVPDVEEIVETYYARSRNRPATDLSWYFAFNLFRLAAISQGVKKRVLDGTASSKSTDSTTRYIAPLAASAWEQARVAGARAT